MRIVLNGSPHELPERTTIAALVAAIDAGGAGGRGVAVAVDAEVVPRSGWDGFELADGQRVEVLGAIQGG
jgi:sulfur carrier protein